MDSVEFALKTVPEEFYVLEPDGRLLPQTSHSGLIATILRASDILAGARVLEIGTGSGFSTALLSHLVGPSGSVVSLEIDSAVANRARRLLSERGADNALVLTADGQKGCSARSPYDRIISWASAEQIPQDWVQQLLIGGSIIAPVSLGPAAHAIAFVRVRRESDDKIIGERLIAGSCVPLSESALQGWGMAPKEADIVMDRNTDPQTWLSAPWLRETDAERDKTRVLQQALTLSADTDQKPLEAGESIEAFRAYLLSISPDELTTACIRSAGHAIGCSSTQGIALLCLRNGLLFTSGENSVVRTLKNWIADWRSVGCPGFEQLQPAVEVIPGGWAVRA